MFYETGLFPDPHIKITLTFEPHLGSPKHFMSSSITEKTPDSYELSGTKNKCVISLV